MAYDIFISYSSKDNATADAVCARLEAQGWRCWIAPRDVLPGAPYGESIIQAIHHCRLMVLVFSSHSNNSPQVMREVERAVSLGLAILPFRIEAVPLSPNMEYFISAPHWLEALTPPLEPHLQRLADAATLILTSEGKMPAQIAVSPDNARRSGTHLGPSTVVPSGTARRGSPAKWWPLAGTALLVVLLGGIWAFSHSSPPTSAESATTNAPTLSSPTISTEQKGDAPSASEVAPAAGPNHPTTKVSGRVGESLSSGSWNFEVLDCKQVSSHAMKKTTEADYALYHNATDFDNNTFSPKVGNALFLLNCRLTNTSGEKQALWHYDTNTALLDPQGESYPPVAFDMRGGQTQSEPLLPGTQQEFAVLFALPTNVQPKELLFTLKTIDEKEGTDVRVSLG
ncbi:hypothetical protein IAD21_04648 [Abditibacteriota bacterium]|nr:hypothetical protein IAD21_04648 [Abditibacteriota bacterium]